MRRRGTMRFTPLTQDLGIFNTITPTIKWYYSNLVANNKELRVPNLNDLDREFPNIREYFIQKYKESYPNWEGTTVSPDMMYAQAVCDSTLVFIFNKEKGVFKLYTSRGLTLEKITEDHKHKPEKTLEINESGRLNIMRLDIEYNGYDDLSVKIVNTAREKVNIEDYEIYPYNLVHSLQMEIERWLKTSNLMVTQNINGIHKERIISIDEETLKNHVEGYVPSTKVWQFLANGYLYAPVVGAPDMTVGLTRINPLFITKITRIKGNTGLVPIGKSNVKDLITPSIISRIVRGLREYARENGEEKDKQFLNFLFKLETVSKYYTPSPEDDIDTQFDRVLKTLRYARGEELVQVREALGSLYTDLEGRYLDVFKGIIPIQVNSFETLRELANKHIVKATVLNKQATLSVVIGTNNEQLLKAIYGEGYFEKYESIGVRRRRALYEFEQSNGSLTEEQIRQLYHIPEDVSLYEDKSPDRSAFEGTTVTVRELFGVVTSENKVEEYYRNIKFPSLISVQVLG